MNTSSAEKRDWKDTARPFDRLAREYDSWFEGNPLFRIELAALLAVQEKPAHPSLEIGVGPGRFARALDIDFGIDPAISPLQFAGSRNILCMQAVGEKIPVRSGCMGTVFILFTLCFLADPAQVLRECFRILKPDGRLLIGMIPGMSKWGELITRKKEENNPFYRHARLRSVAETKALLSLGGFSVIESWSTLFQPPGNTLTAESPRQGSEEDAGFCVLVLKKKEADGGTTQPDYPDN
ncbi:MAG: class I SAM-dependent methyltransferase [Desulfobulbaceae bacterium]|nr:class I SAM-dependent methyltransferase [Desulfobulbaceae bacterium]